MLVSYNFTCSILSGSVQQAQAHRVLDTRTVMMMAQIRANV